MRTRTFLFAIAVAAGLATPQGATAAPPPDPRTCTAAVEVAATPADPLGLVATGVIAVGSGQVVCTRDPLTTAPVDLLNWGGHISVAIQVNGVTPPGCSSGPNPTPAVGPVLVLAAVQTCFIPVSDPNRLGTVSMVMHFATVDANTYNCCDVRIAYATPIGVDV